MGVCLGQPWSTETRDVEWAVPVHLEREAGTTVGPTWDGMEQGHLGVWAETAGTPGCGHALGPSEAPEEPARLKGRGKGHVALDTHSGLPSAGMTLMAFPSPGTKS